METYFTYSRVLKRQRDKDPPGVPVLALARPARASAPKAKRRPSLLDQLRLASASQSADA